jgi:hypothetical protein
MALCSGKRVSRDLGQSYNRGVPGPLDAWKVKAFIVFDESVAI